MNEFEFFFSGQFLDSSFSFEGMRLVWKLLAVHHGTGTSRFCVFCALAAVVHGKPSFWISCPPCIKGVIAASEDVYIIFAVHV